MTDKFSEKIKKHLGHDAIVVIEPTPTYRGILKTFFNDMRFKHVMFFNTVDEARRFMLVTNVGLLIVEKNLPVTDGLQFFHELRFDTKRGCIPYLLMGTERLQENLVAVTERGVEAFVMKPFAFSDLYQQIFNLLVNAKNPSHFHRLIGRANDHLKKGDLWVAEAFFMKAHDISPKAASVMCGLAQISIANQDYVDAAKKLELAASLNPNYLWTREISRQLQQRKSGPVEKKGA